MAHQAKKRFGQNFLKDKNLLKKIVESAHIEHQNVIEIGPGQGALTGFLAAKATYVLAYEIDLSLKPILHAFETEYPNLKIIYEDFMKADLSILQGLYHVVANVPYYITTPILFKVIEAPQIQSATLMVQKEVAERLLAKQGDKAYNALSLVIQSKTVATKVMDVKRHLFHPVPNVDSVVIRIVKRDNPLMDDTGITWIKAAFIQKRKTLVNNWHQAFDISKQKLEEVLKANGYPTDIRAEQLNLDDFKQLIEVLR